MAHTHSHAVTDAGVAHLHTDDGLRVALIATAGLLLTGAFELAIFAVFARSAGLLADAFHNLGDVSTTVVIAVAGMEGALPSVIGGLVECPVIAVPTTVGYGAAFGGLAALLGMLNSCAPGVTVVNIDNGFGAGYLAGIINRMARAERGEQTP